MTTNNKKPAIRFKGFDEEWEERKLGELGILKNGMNFSKDAMGIGFPFVNLQNIFGRSVIDIDNLGLAMASQKQLKEYNLLEGDVLFVRSSVKLEGVGEAAIIPETLENTTYSGFVIRFRDNVGLSKEFKRIAFQTVDVRRQILSQATDSANKNISQTVLSNLTFMLPSKEEQTQIGTYFRNLDSLISLQQKKCEQLANVKKSMLQKMFPKNGSTVPELRFAGFTGDWEQRKWCDTVDISREMVNPSSGTFDELPHIAPGNMESFSGRLYANVKLVKDEQLISGKFHFYPDDIIYGKINPQLGKYYYSSIEGLTSADAYVLNAKNGVKQKYLFFIIQTRDFFNYSVSVSKRSGMPKINRDELNAYSFFAPTEEEQECIGQFLLNLDNLITLQRRKLDKLNNIKKSMLQKMFV